MPGRYGLFTKSFGGGLLRNKMDKLIKLIGGVRNRDKFIRLCQYILRFLAGSGRSVLSRRLEKLADEFANCRAFLRLFEDIPFLAYTLHYGLGKQEPNAWMRILELANHVAWLARKGIVDLPSKTWGIPCLWAWGTSQACEILKAISRIYMIRNELKTLLNEQNPLLMQQKLDVRNERPGPSEMPEDIKIQIQYLKKQENDKYLAVIESSADLINAVNWLPPGSLWSGKISPRISGGLGALSSAIKVYRLQS